MTTLLNMALINAVTVLPLGLLAFFVSRVARRPALTHSLWVLVLLKFVTPPLFNLPVTIELPDSVNSKPNPVASRPVATPYNAGSEFPVNAEPLATTPASRELPSSINRPIAASSGVRVAGRDSTSWIGRALRAGTACLASRPDGKSLLLIGWMGGAAFWFGLQTLRAVRFQRRILRDAFAPDELQEQTRRLAIRLGLRCVPQVLIVNATVSPMLWGCGSRAKLLFPSDLAERLDHNARATLLTHELAHFIRGDHWVRVLELISTAIFWWHPVVWWARHRIEEAEEECCDAWVVSQFPDTPRQYAEALLDTIDFLCESRRPLPPVACGLGHAHFIRHRLTRIMQGAAPKALSARARAVLLLAAVLLLPLQPFVFGSASVALSQHVSAPTSAIADAEASPQPQVRDDKLQLPIDDKPSPFQETAVSNESPTTPQSSRVRPIRGEKVWSTAASPDGRFVVRATTTRRIVLTDLTTNSETDLSNERITAVAFAPDGDWFAAGGQDGRVTIWDSARGKLLRTVMTHTDGLRSIAVSPRGLSIAAGGRDGTVHLIDPVTGESLTNLLTRSSAANCVRFSSDGRQLAVAVGDWMSGGRGEVALINTSTGQIDASLACATSPGAVTFASNEELIVGLWDGRTQLWNLVNRQIVGSANADKSAVAAAAFSPDNPALREAMFVAEQPTSGEEPSALSVLRRLFANPTQ